MNSPYLGEHVHSSDVVRNSEQVIDSVVIESPPYLTHGDENLMEEPDYPESPVVPGIPPIERKSNPVVVAPQSLEAVVQPVSPNTNGNTGSVTALLGHPESDHFRMRWNQIQSQFVDEPRTAVQQADTLVSDVVTQITQMFAKERGSLELQWKQGSDVSTEDLRKALQHYRSFFNRLVI